MHVYGGRLKWQHIHENAHNTIMVCYVVCVSSLGSSRSQHCVAYTIIHIIIEKQANGSNGISSAKTRR